MSDPTYPLRPRGVVVRLVTGDTFTVADLDLVYVGLDEEGLHTWLAPTPIGVTQAEAFMVTFLPAMTTVSVGLIDDRE